MNPELLAELKSLITSHGSSEWRPVQKLPSVTLTIATEPTVPIPHVCEPMAVFVVQGMHSISLGNSTLDCGAGQYLVVPVDLPLALHVSAATPDQPYLSVRYALKPDQIAALLLEAETGPHAGTAPSGIAVSDMTPDLIDAVLRLVRLLDRPSDIPALAAASEREMLWRLLNSPQGSLIRQVGIASSRMNQIAMATRRIRNRYAETLRIEELASSVGMSVTSFHRHFRAITTLTPIQYQKQLRLQMARSMLIGTADDVTAVGYAVGYDSPSQFSREYKRLFGYPPGKDGKRLARMLSTASHFEQD